METTKAFRILRIEEHIASNDLSNYGIVGNSQRAGFTKLSHNVFSTEILTDKNVFLFSIEFEFSILEPLPKMLPNHALLVFFWFESDSNIFRATLRFALQQISSVPRWGTRLAYSKLCTAIIWATFTYTQAELSSITVLVLKRPLHLRARWRSCSRMEFIRSSNVSCTHVFDIFLR